MADDPKSGETAPVAAPAFKFPFDGKEFTSTDELEGYLEERDKRQVASQRETLESEMGERFARERELADWIESDPRVQGILTDHWNSTHGQAPVLSPGATAPAAVPAQDVIQKFLANEDYPEDLRAALRHTVETVHRMATAVDGRLGQNSEREQARDVMEEYYDRFGSWVEQNKVPQEVASYLDERLRSSDIQVDQVESAAAAELGRLRAVGQAFSPAPASTPSPTPGAVPLPTGGGPSLGERVGPKEYTDREDWREGMKRTLIEAGLTGPPGSQAG